MTYVAVADGRAVTLPSNVAGGTRLDAFMWATTHIPYIESLDVTRYGSLREYLGGLPRRVGDGWVLAPIWVDETTTGPDDHYTYMHMGGRLSNDSPRGMVVSGVMERVTAAMKNFVLDSFSWCSRVDVVRTGVEFDNVDVGTPWGGVTTYGHTYGRHATVRVELAVAR